MAVRLVNLHRQPLRVDLRGGSFVLLAPGHSPSEALKDSIRAHVKGQLAPYQQPREIEFVDELPMTTTGKVQRRVLREREYRGASGS